MFSKPKPEKKQKKSKKPINKSSSRGKIKKKAHAIMRDIVMLRDKECVCPPPKNGHSEILQAGHLIPGTKGGTYFDLYNVNLQCQGCNGRHEHYECYYTDWFLLEFGETEYHRLKKDADNLGLKSYELEEIIVQLQLIREKQLSNPEWKPRFTQQEILSGAWSADTTGWMTNDVSKDEIWREK